jgi:23S rRNA pseudouridine2605 synthase
LTNAALIVILPGSANVPKFDIRLIAFIRGRLSRANFTQESRIDYMAKTRLQRILAAAGVASRRRCEELILEGAVTVNGVLVNELPAFADPEDVIRVNGQTIKKENKVYYLLNKPKGYICTSFDPQGRKTVVDIVPVKERVFCVGRLDADTTGAIILTNDNEMANRLTHPRYELAKTYEVLVKGVVNAEVIEKLKRGVWLSEGKTERSSIKLLKKGVQESLIEMTIRQGRNRQVRRMFARVGLKVKKLKRSQIGAITLKGIGIGSFKPLTGKQISYLKKATKLENDN